MSNSTKTPSEQRNVKTRRLLGKLVSMQILGLYKLIESFGGELLADRVDSLVMEKGNWLSSMIIVKKGRVQKIRTDMPWSRYTEIMHEVIDFSTSVAGTQLVRERVHDVTQRVEERTGMNCYEIGFRIGLERDSTKWNFT